MENKITNLIEQLETNNLDQAANLKDAVHSLISIEPDDRIHRLDRIHYLLEKMKFSHERGSLSRTMIETIISDINILCSLSDLTKIHKNGDKEPCSNSKSKNEKLIEYCYSSKAIKPFTHEELLELRKKAKIKNTKKNITGFLAYDESSQSFFQILEGPEKQVRSIIQKIIKDPRHTDYRLRFQVNIKERSYKNWALSLVTSSEISSEIAHVDELDDWLCNELFINKNIDISKSREWVVDNLKAAYLNSLN